MSASSPNSNMRGVHRHNYARLTLLPGEDALLTLGLKISSSPSWAGGWHCHDDCKPQAVATVAKIAPASTLDASNLLSTHTHTGAWHRGVVQGLSNHCYVA